MRPGIVAALPGEAAAFARLRPGATQALAGGARIALSGLGAARAAATARALVAAGADALVSWGSAAALLPQLSPGDLLLPRGIVAVDGRRLDTDVVWRQQLAEALAACAHTHDGTLAETPAVLVDAAAKRALARRSGAIAADMESAAVAAVAAAQGVPFVVIRAVADDAATAMPAAAIAAVDGEGALQPLRMLRALAARPRQGPAQLRALAHLARAFRAAQRSLACAAVPLLAGTRA